MSQLVRLEGKHTTQNAHCALEFRPWRVSLPKLFPIFFNNFQFVQIQIQVLLSKYPGDRLWRLCNSSQHFLCHKCYECNWNFSKGRVRLLKWMDFRTNSKRPLTPSPIFGKLFCHFFENVRKKPYIMVQNLQSRLQYEMKVTPSSEVVRKNFVSLTRPA